MTYSQLQAFDAEIQGNGHEILVILVSRPEDRHPAVEIIPEEHDHEKQGKNEDAVLLAVDESKPPPEEQHESQDNEKDLDWNTLVVDQQQEALIEEQHNGQRQGCELHPPQKKEVEHEQHEVVGV